ncbi:hypothetical protein ElyMa_004465000 [Elysia marginata]|uniref:Uncharacterized protein n=1 Tax=Elysia marginata TaxID=1093978 RepID=A0AAV4HGU5_9GAST|nr:hypothetical protein ElyMa_004465000 [Elysia marginata]
MCLQMWPVQSGKRLSDLSEASHSVCNVEVTIATRTFNENITESNHRRTRGEEEEGVTTPTSKPIKLAPPVNNQPARLGTQDEHGGPKGTAVMTVIISRPGNLPQGIPTVLLVNNGRVIIHGRTLHETLVGRQFRKFCFRVCLTLSLRVRCVNSIATEGLRMARMPTKCPGPFGYSVMETHLTMVTSTRTARQWTIGGLPDP